MVKICEWFLFDKNENIDFQFSQYFTSSMLQSVSNINFFVVIFWLHSLVFTLLVSELSLGGIGPRPSCPSVL